MTCATPGMGQSSPRATADALEHEGEAVPHMSFIPFAPDPSWYERYWLTEESESRAVQHSPVAENRSSTRNRGTALIALAYFTAAAACGAGLEHFHILCP
jgi:hypothetical protein